MNKGTVKFFDRNKGWGFLTDENGNDVFIHYSGIVGDGFKTLGDGQRVTFDVIDTEKGKQAVNVEVVKKSKGGQEKIMNKEHK